MIIDAHNDLLLEVSWRRGEENPFGKYWLPKLRAGGVAIQVCPTHAALEHLPEAALRRCLEQIYACYRAVKDNCERVHLIRCDEDLCRAERNNSIGLVLAMEGVESFGYDPDMATIFWELGVRMFGLTWNRRNPFADGAAEPVAGGLSRLGRELVEQLVAMGAIIDLAHAGERTYGDVLEHAQGGNLVVSHGGCRAVHDTPRNLTDEQLRGLAERRGVLCVMGHPLTVDPERRTLDRVVDHIDHAVSVMGAGAVGLGADFTRQVIRSGAWQTPGDALLPEGLAADAAIEKFEGPEDYPNLVEALRARGHSGQAIEAILGKNVFTLLERALPPRTLASDE